VRLSLIKITGLVLGVCGAAVLIFLKDNIHAGPNMLMGDIFILINAISYAFYMVLVRPLMKQYSPVHVIRWIFTIGALILLPFGWQQFAATNWSGFDINHWLALTLVCVGATFLAYLFNMYGISVVGASATGSYIYIQPVFAATIAMIFLGEKLSVYKIVAALLIFTGVYFVNWKRSKS